MFVTRFAPSPTGPLHLGHAFSALLAHDQARAAGGTFLLRIDDLDQSRSRRSWEDQIFEDLDWLGVSWDGPVRRQSEHFDDYKAVIASMAEQGVIYPCRCKRRDIEAALSAPQEDGSRNTPRFGPDGLVYPGTCKGRRYEDRLPTDALRFDIDKAELDPLPSFTEIGPLHAGEHQLTMGYLQSKVGDPVIARAQMAASYHLSVVLDDAASQVTHVIRGADLFEATFIQRMLQRHLRVQSPTYYHHKLIRDEAGKRLAKRDDARAIAKYRAEGATPGDIRHMVGL
ncbi:MAG: tRNA glutamyl-Q(34) synthetase GluQRS [Pelagimonas sp.]|uniref:tRNA glutamyl-Q(34) synthetase GluQRS n=1 Tax=Pelagimonas sp. TaxID=2073170 RepID=UPI003D6A7783